MIKRRCTIWRGDFYNILPQFSISECGVRHFIYLNLESVIFLKIFSTTECSLSLEFDEIDLLAQADKQHIFFVQRWCNFPLIVRTFCPQAQEIRNSIKCTSFKSFGLCSGEARGRAGRAGHD
jgi:hypothetical protein